MGAVVEGELLLMVVVMALAVLVGVVAEVVMALAVVVAHSQLAGHEGRHCEYHLLLR